MTTLFRTITLVLVFAIVGAVTGCSGVPQDDRYQTNKNGSWDNWRG